MMVLRSFEIIVQTDAEEALLYHNYPYFTFLLIYSCRDVYINPEAQWGQIFYCSVTRYTDMFFESLVLFLVPK